MRIPLFGRSAPEPASEPTNVAENAAPSGTRAWRPEGRDSRPIVLPANETLWRGSLVRPLARGVGKSLTEAPLMYTIGGDKVEGELADRLAMMEPSPATLAKSAADFHVLGNALFKRRRVDIGDGTRGGTERLDYLSPFNVEVTYDGSQERIVAYHLREPASLRSDLIGYIRRIFRQSWQWKQYDPEDIVHLMDEPDEDRPYVGASKLDDIAVELALDSETTTKMRIALRKIGQLISPKRDPEGNADNNAREAMEVRAQFFLERLDALRDSVDDTDTVISPYAMEAGVLGRTPQELMVDEVRAFVESRVAFNLGYPAPLAGLLVGLRNSPWSKLSESREIFAEDTLIPLGRSYAHEWTRLVTAEFNPDIETAFDIGVYRVLQPDETAKSTRIVSEVNAGILSPRIAFKVLGYEEQGYDFEDSFDSVRPEPAPMPPPETGDGGEPEDEMDDEQDAA